MNNQNLRHLLAIITLNAVPFHSVANVIFHSPSSHFIQFKAWHTLFVLKKIFFLKKLGALFELISDVTHAGCSLKLILDWAWDRVVDIKDQLDQLCKNSEFPFY